MSNNFKKQRSSDEKIDLILEESKFITQYCLAVSELLNNKNNTKFIYPIINLIHQTIELELKSLIVDNHINNKTYYDLEISNEHNLENLIKHNSIKKYYEDIIEIECEFTALNKCIQYFYKLLGDNTFQKSRYAIEKKQNIISEKKPINFKELKKQWTIFSLLSVKLHLIHIAYYIVNDIPLLVDKSSDCDICKISEICEKSIISEIPVSEKNSFENYIKLYKQKFKR